MRAETSPTTAHNLGSWMTLIGLMATSQLKKQINNTQTINQIDENLINKSEEEIDETIKKVIILAFRNGFPKK